jgi:hypothetical protein
VRFVPSIILLNKAALVEQYYLVIHADASAGNEGILENPTTIRYLVFQAENFHGYQDLSQLSQDGIFLVSCVALASCLYLERRRGL